MGQEGSSTLSREGARGQAATGCPAGRPRAWGRRQPCVPGQTSAVLNSERRRPGACKEGPPTCAPVERGSVASTCVHVWVAGRGEARRGGHARLAAGSGPRGAASCSQPLGHSTAWEPAQLRCSPAKCPLHCAAANCMQVHIAVPCPQHLGAALQPERQPQAAPRIPVPPLGWDQASARQLRGLFCMPSEKQPANSPPGRQPAVTGSRGRPA